MTFEEWWPTLGQTIGKVAARAAWDASAKIEREACAKVCEDYADSHCGTHDRRGEEYAASNCANAIRARQ